MVVVLVVEIAVLLVEIAVLLLVEIAVLAAERAAADVAAAAAAAVRGQKGTSQCCDTDCQICKVSFQGRPKETNLVRDPKIEILSVHLKNIPIIPPILYIEAC